MPDISTLREQSLNGGKKISDYQPEVQLEVPPEVPPEVKLEMKLEVELISILR